MNDELQQALNDIVEMAMLIGATQSKKSYGVYTEMDSRFEAAMHETIAKYRKTIEAALRTELVQGEVAPAHPPLFDDMQLVPCALWSDGWLCVPHADNKWVTAAKLEPFSLAVINYWLKGRPTPQPAIAQPSPKQEK